ncbi:hypothetical protein F4V57_01740 [Acinetobacter qingfengensis]|uniref:Uncharacterized protein n=1 Tax=Acinetobacter qingfengensis TaxID=1262585 RepID=A0A1E7R940_9GAMM|nr:hypothetical protein [Acinetobacter qingfengensis]KAA8735542.1 hypothetical protein F4V57_01740 [Acinetobacter qingfengensis]OEY95811.1 hypothetical protein BJI46_02500 [Acinetobacter qingfengensis]
MGNNFQFLVNKVGATLDDAIELLNQASIDFKLFWQSRDNEGCYVTSQIAIKNFDYIINEIVRERDALSLSANAQYAQDYRDILDVHIGEVDENITPQDFQDLTIQPGNARIRVGKITKPISLNKLLNKMKHRIPNCLNFRIENGDHILVIGADAFLRQPECIVEFKVEKFCSESQKISDLFKSNAS